MADYDLDYGAAGQQLGDSIKDTISPLDAHGIDPDEANLDRAAVLKQINGSGPEGTGKELTDPSTNGGVEVAQNEVPPQPGTGRYSPGGVALPQGLYTHSNPSDAPDAAATGGATQQTPDQSAVAPAADGSTPQAASTPKSWQDFARQALAQQQTSAAGAQQAVTDLASQPTEQQLIQPTQDKLDQVSQPLDPRAAQYKPGIGSKILRGLAGAGLGLAGGGVMGAAAGAINPRITSGTGYNDPNRDYQIDTAMRASTANTLKDRIAQTQKAYSDLSTRAKGIATEERANAGVNKDIVTGAQGMENADTAANKPRPMDEQAFEGLVKSGVSQIDAFRQVKEAGNIKDPSLMQQTMDALASGDQAKIARIKKTIDINKTAPAVAVVDARADDRAPTGGGKGGDKPKALTPAANARITGTKNVAMQRAQAQLRSKMDKSGNQYGMADYVQDLQSAQDNYEQQIESAGGSVDHMTVTPDGRFKSDSGAGSATPTQVKMAPQNTGPTPTKAVTKGATPPSSLLAKYKEGDVIQGRNGEAFVKKGGRWIQQ